MNKDRRKQIYAVIADLEALREKIEDARLAIEAIRDEEQDYFDNMPESFQQGDKGCAAEEAVSQLDDAICDIEAFDIDSIISCLNEAQA